MGAFSEKLVAFVGADITEYARKVGVQVPKIARGAAGAMKSIGRVAGGAFAAVGRAASLALKPLRAVASVLTSIGGWVYRQGKRAFYAIAAGLGAATREAIFFETAMAEVWSILDVGKDRINRLGDDVLKLAARFGEAPARMAKAAYQAISAGISGDKVGSFLGTAAKAGVAGISDTFTSVDVLTSLINAYGKSAEWAGHVSDLLFTTVREGKTTFAELAGSIGPVAPIAAQAGVALEEVLATISTLTKSGFNTANAVTSLRQTLVSIISPSRDALEAADELGIRFDAASLRAKGLGGFLNEIAVATKGDVEALARLFPNVRALSGVMGLAGTQSREFARQLGVMQEAAGATDKAFAKIANTVGFRLKAAWATIRVAGVKIGDVFKEGSAGFVETLAEWAMTAADWIRSNADRIRSTLSTLWNWVAEQAYWVKDQVVAALDQMRGESETIWDAVARKAGAVWNWIVETWEGLKSTLSPIIQALGKAIVGDFKGAWDDLRPVFDEGVKTLLDVLEHWLPEFCQMGINALDELIKGLTDSGVIERVGELVGKIAEVLFSQENISKYARWGVAIGMQIGKGIWAGVRGALSALGDALLDKLADAGEWIAEKGGGFGPVDYAIADNMIGPIQTSGDIPHFGDGGVVYEPTLAVVGEKGPERISRLDQPDAGRSMHVEIHQHYRTDRREAERLAELTRRLSRRGRLGFAY